MDNLAFDNRFVRELPADPDDSPRRRQVYGALYSRVRPTPVAAPRLLAWSPEVAQALGLSQADVEDARFARVFAGNELLAGMQPYAAAYGGHQFGHWAGQLGDGRAISLGEVLTAAGQRLELQLKGAGPTPYSRTADGRAVLRSSVREFLCSEAMHHLGVPTTRALCLVGTGESVVRDMFYDGRPRAEPGAVVCRVAPSFIRFGHFELPAARRDLALLRRLVAFTVARDFPELPGAGEAPDEPAVLARWFAAVCERTAWLMVHWQRVGFVHGVMNTDNLSILGLTIDYGPYGWMDHFDPDWTPNTTDAGERRYRYAQQPGIALWNLERLAEALAPLFGTARPLEECLEHYLAVFRDAYGAMAADKLGLGCPGAQAWPLLDDLFEVLREGMADMTLFFRGLAEVDPAQPGTGPLEAAFYEPSRRAAADAALRAWLERYLRQVAAEDAPQARQRRMAGANPLYVPRNYLAQEAIDRAEQGDPGGIAELLEVLRQPYTAQPGRARYAARRPAWALDRPGCSMLSCSS